MDANLRGSVLLAFPGEREAGHVASVARRTGLLVAETVKSAQEAVSFLCGFETDYVFASILLPGLALEGLSAQIGKKALYRRPAVLYFVPACAGAVMKEAYAPVITTPTDEKTLITALSKLRPAPVRREDREAARTILLKMGFREGRALEYLAYACAMCANDSNDARRLRGCIYPAVANAFSISQSQAADGMRRVIDRAFLSGNMDFQYALFANTIDEMRGKPTVSQLLALVGETVRRGDGPC